MAGMRQVTQRGYVTYEVISAFQKSMRRGLEKEAMYWFIELECSGFWSWACKRILVTLHEDIGTNADVMYTVTQSVAQAKEWYSNKSGEWGICIANAILTVCRAEKKTRESGHFYVQVLGDRANGFQLEMPDYALDQHTRKGKQLGRGEDFFREESAKLSNPAPKDEYEDQAYVYWHQFEKNGKSMREESGKSIQQLENDKGLFEG